jgi:hypothetical protein
MSIMELNRIEDAGQKIGGARKDLWRERGLNERDLDVMTPAEIIKYTTKQNIWPRPDYRKLIADGCDPVEARLVKTVYDRVPAKPRAVRDGKNIYVSYIRGVQAIRAAVECHVCEEISLTDGEHLLSEACKRFLDQSTDGADEYNEAMKAIRAVIRGSANPSEFRSFDRSDAEREVKDGWPNKPVWSKQLKVIQKSSSEFILARTASGGGLDAKLFDAIYDTKEEAEAAADKIFKASTKKTKIGLLLPHLPHLDKVVRIGPDRRCGRDVTAEEVLHLISGHGVEFGNWLPQNERQEVVNHAYDAMFDLADVLGVPVNSLSMGGILSLAFGARGSGRFAAHYEPERTVINLTKLKGAGSLSHEYGHAMDYIFGEISSESPFASSCRAVSGGRKRSQRMKELPFGSEINDAWKELFDALYYRKKTTEETLAELHDERNALPRYIQSIENSLRKISDGTYEPEHWEPSLETGIDKIMAYKSVQLVTEQNGLDKLDKKIAMTEAGNFTPGSKTSNFYQEAVNINHGAAGYWSRPTELVARAFNAWVFDEIVSRGWRSDYLAHSCEQNRYGTEYAGKPFPEGEERLAINAAFRRLFEELAKHPVFAGRWSPLQSSRQDIALSLSGKR